MGVSATRVHTSTTPASSVWPREPYHTSAGLKVVYYIDVIERVSANAFKLDLGISVSSRTIDVFHVKYLRPTIDGPYRPSVTLQPLPVAEDDDEPEYEIERILDRKRRQGKFEYLVQYTGYPLLKDCQWRPHDELTETAPQMLEEFTATFSKDPAPTGRNKRRRK